MIKDDTLVFAVSYADARQLCKDKGLEFDETVWVLRLELLGNSLDYLGYDVYYSDAFRRSEHYDEAFGEFGPSPAGQDD